MSPSRPSERDCAVVSGGTAREPVRAAGGRPPCVKAGLLALQSWSKVIYYRTSHRHQREHPGNIVIGRGRPFDA